MKWGLSMIGLYCCWGAKAYKNGFYVSAVNGKYINSFNKRYGKILLLTNTSREEIKEDDIFISYEECELYSLPEFKSYLSALKHFAKIYLGMKALVEKTSSIYIKTPDPFCWLFAFFKKKGQSINYHFVSNPIEVIVNDDKRAKYAKLLRLCIYYPEFILTCLAASFNSVSANGPSVCNNVPFFLKKKIRILIESTITDNEMELKKNSVPRVIGTNRYLFVSRLVPGKGLENLIDAFYILIKKRNLDFEGLYIAGDGPLRIMMEYKISNYKIQDKIKLLGNIANGPELNKLYSSCDIFINPSLSETGPRVLLEAMSEGCFCISTNVGYASYLLSNGNDCGVVIEPDSINAIVESVLWVTNHVEDINVMSAAGKDLSKKYTLDRFVENAIRDMTDD